MQIAPETDIILLKTPFEMNDNNQLTFSNATNQYNYFNSLPKLELHDATYQRKDEVVRWAGRFDDIISYNYCMYRNSSYSNKWFYAFIDDLKYVNDNMTEIKLKTDVFQSWQFNIVYKQSFVEREHVNNDTIGAHTIPEGLETGEFICNFTDDINISEVGGVGICCMCSDFPPLLEQFFKKSIYNGVFSGGKAIIFLNVEDASAFVQYMEVQAMGEAIISFFLVPISSIAGDLTFYQKELDFDASIFGVDKKIITFGSVGESYGVTYMGQTTLSNITRLNGYTPRNKKLFTGDYNYLYLTNNAGGDIKFNYEDFVNNLPSFELWGAFGVGGSIKLMPTNYLKFNTSENIGAFYNYGLNAGKYPVCSWNSDSYTAWLSQNSLNLAFGEFEGLAHFITGGLSSNPISAAQGAGKGISTIFDSLKQRAIHSVMPNQAKGNTNLGELQYAAEKICFTFYKMSVRREYAEVIDDYFDTYGYKVNSLKLPNINGRRNWNYVKTIGINILGDIPQKDLEEIRNIFDNGVTLWHNPNTFLDYSQDNSII